MCTHGVEEANWDRGERLHEKQLDRMAMAQSADVGYSDLGQRVTF